MLFYGDLIDVGYTFIVYFSQIIGDVAQLARALDWQSRGEWFFWMCCVLLIRRK